MSNPPLLPIEEILAAEPASADGIEIGRSREDRPLVGHLLGHGPIAVSLIAGCHADEPVGPAMLDRLAGFLGSQTADHPALATVRWVLVPHANPDGDARNRAWFTETRPLVDHRGETDQGYDLAAYLHHVVRELPGDDLEFGFPRKSDDSGARPENRAIAALLQKSSPFALHGSFHGMAFAPGPWFLIEASWAARTEAMRRALRRQVSLMGYRVFDVDRKGEKGFFRIDEGFSSRPDSRAMATHFRARGELEMAELFRPSSMEYARRLSGDCFTFVSEMPLFLRPPLASTGDNAPPSNIGSANRRHFHAWLGELVADRDADAAQAEAARHGIHPMPIRDQMRLQLALLNKALDTVRQDPITAKTRRSGVSKKG